MLNEIDESEWSELIPPPAGRGTRARERLRNAIARRKLEALHELKRLQTALTEPWEEGE